ncbi:exo-beta-N-acetylmuramidase NamZ domain-containing protein [Trinickia diaoshuihuensis]|uniref:exo-beta-N-acetylmuramidase NamZ domain-containing protein n=1 Tax=Trinickia diaoshuihuensis TaxID=2292265 RepID=UPI000E2641C9|nr:exo-beta-N-acetylmuramidase NamZ domain-containing protein [Trinickia diaoshuihuensis]
MESAQPIRRGRLAALIIVRLYASILLAGSAVCAGAELADPERSSANHELTRIVDGEIASRRISGALIVAGDRDGVSYRQAFGSRAVTPVAEPMAIDTEFDVASLTKVVATTTAIMQLAETHRIALDAPVMRYWPAFAANGKSTVTVRELLTHTSGFAPDLPLGKRAQTRAGVLAEVIAEPLRAPPGERVIYSDINFVVLGELIRRVSHESLDGYCEAHLFAPLHMRDTRFRLDLSRMARTAPTTPDRSGMRRGRVHDPTAERMGGVSGNAGLFSTGDDLARFARMLLNDGDLDGRRILKSETVASLAVPALVRSPPEQERGLGWALDAPLVSNRDRLPAYGTLTHTGYTGTALWIDLVSKRFIVVLTNRVHPDDRGDAKPLRAQVVAWFASQHTALSVREMTATLPGIEPAVTAGLRLPLAAGPVRTGIDVLEAQRFAPIAGLRVGLVTNRSGFDANGRRTIDVLANAPGVHLAGIFAPEHGLGTDLDAPLGDSIDPATGIAVRSLYGATQRFPADSLDGLDALLFDLQDAGVRFFTYETTLGYALEAAARKGIPLFVLDRPNPLGGDRFGGPLLDPGRESFTGYFPLPLVPGMSVGELASLFNGERRLQADLRVVAMQGYSRSMRFADTGLGWVPPSPNLRTEAQLDLYPDVGMIEGANLSVGRGTTHPFEWIGAPWIDGPQLAAALDALHLGVRIAPIDFVPTESAYRGQQCHGIAISRADMPPAPGRLGVALLVTLHALYRSQFDLAATRASIGSDAVWDAVNSGAGLGAVETIESETTARFAPTRARYLRY